jgi:type II secretory pathway pseudopilin PulG
MNREPNKGRRCTAYGRKDPRPRSLYAVYRIPSTSSDGYAFVVLMIAMTVMLIALAAALPSVYHESQREKEEELIFRGNEYARAIYLFQRQFQRFPKSVDELIRTNNIRFLRHAYKDPMNPKGKWRFIHVAGNGMLIDSLTMGPQAQTQLVGASGQSPPGQSGFGQSGFGQGGFGQGASGQSGFGQSPSDSSQSSFNSGFNSGEGNGAGPQQPSNAQSQSSSAFGQSQGGQANQDAQKDKKEKIRAACEGNKSESAFLPADNQSLGTLIGGVASCSEKSSIRVWNKKTKYEEWEFLGVGYQVAAFPALPQPQQQQPQSGIGGQTTQPGQGFGLGQGGAGAGGPGPTPPGVQPQNPSQPPPQNAPDTPLIDQPGPDQPVDSPEAPDNPPQ